MRRMSHRRPGRRGHAPSRGDHAALAVTLADATLVATGAVKVKGTLAVTLDGATLVATGTVSTPAPPGIDPATFTARMYYDGADYDATLGLWPGRPSAGNSDHVLRIATQTTSGQRPTTGATLNGITTVQFARVNSTCLDVGTGAPTINGPMPSVGDMKNWTCFVLYNWDNTSAPDHALSQAYDNEAMLSDPGANRVNFAMRLAALQILTDPGGGRTGVEETATFAASTWQLGVARGSDTDTQIRVNSGSFVALGTNGRANVVSALRIGSSSNPPGQYWNGLIACLIMIEGYLSDSDCDGVKTWLNNRWGLSL